jgi:hypothetical protein
MVLSVFTEVKIPPRVGWDGVVSQILDSATDGAFMILNSPHIGHSLQYIRVSFSRASASCDGGKNTPTCTEYNGRVSHHTVSCVFLIISRMYLATQGLHGTGPKCHQPSISDSIPS